MKQNIVKHHLHVCVRITGDDAGCPAQCWAGIPINIMQQPASSPEQSQQQIHLVALWKQQTTKLNKALNVKIVKVVFIVMELH